MSKPLFSIITAAYNAETFIKICLDSISCQTFNSYELIIIDGKSSDKTLEIIHNHKLNPKKLISEKDNGIYDAMNKGINISSGKYIYFLNADDSFRNEKSLEMVAKILKKNGFPKIMTFGVKKLFPTFFVIKNAKLSMRNLRAGVMPPHQGMFVHKKVFNQYGKFSNLYTYAGDFEYCCKIISEKSVKSSKEVVAIFKAGGLGSNKVITYNEQKNIIKKYFGNLASYHFIFKKFYIETPVSNLMKTLHLYGLKNWLVKQLFIFQNDKK